MRKKEKYKSPYKLTFLEELERFLRRYILLRLRNPAFVGSYLVAMSQYFKSVTGFSIISDIPWSVMKEAMFSPSVLITLTCFTFLAFLSPTDAKLKDNITTYTELKNLPDIRLIMLERKKMLYEDEMKKEIMEVLNEIDGLSKKEIEQSVAEMTGIVKKPEVPNELVKDQKEG